METTGLEITPMLTDNKLVDEKRGFSIKSITSNSYFKFILRKALFYAFVFFIAISLAFWIPRMLPGDPIAGLLTPPATVTDIEAWNERKAVLESYLGLDLPLWQQYLNFLINFLKGDLGYEYINLIPVSDIVRPRLMFSLILVVPTVALTFVLGNSIGAKIGYKPSRKNNIIYYVFVFLQSAPFFWIAYIFFDIFVLGLRWVVADPPSAIDPFFSKFKLFLMCFIILTLAFTGGWATGARSMMIYEADSDYILYCRKLGFTDEKMREYAKRNAMLPQLTGLNLRFNEILGATFIIEFVFNWPGLGWTTIEAMTQQNYTLIVGTFVVNIMIVVIGNFFIDILYGFIDPRIRIGGDK
ncbi:hypothetical protein NEF87_003071 [Candidatus Lokiarchaeum ossiferum]|uniref:ABC transmembrane type-1 domain-containing protein n=1 Tax=Candidatus Lokiarchaeum ossiferum TaxID=2951803 RepID=A0ABY6HW23_9ARCH|nr:hypothetical protein NEF87_003071 [Candidatus Lokiarchaeum sp. B-35]